MTRSVLVLNHFAVPRGRPGGTRHVELFSRLDGWQYLIIASELNHLTGEIQSVEPGFRPVKVAAFKTNDWRRIVNWISYAISAFTVGVRQPKIDVIYASSPHLLAAFAGWAIALIRGRPFILEVRDLWPKVLVEMGQLSEHSPIYRLLSALEIFLYRRAVAIVVMAEGSRTELIARGVDASKIAYIPNGADPSDFAPSAPREALRERYGFTKFTAIYAGAHGPANGLDLLIDAAGEVRDLSIEIVLVGGGVEKAKLESQARQMCLDNVRFMDPVSKAEIPDLLAAADFGLHVLADVELFRSAVSPNKVFDYMASGRPILTNCPGIVSDLVLEGECGVIVNPTELGDGIRKVANLSDVTRSCMGDHGQSWIRQNQSRSAMAERLSHVLQSVRDS